MTTRETNNDHHLSYPDFHIPEELLAHILLRLPIKTLIRLKSVSKSWNSIISSPHFFRLQCKKNAFSDKKQHLLINHGTCFFSFDYSCYEGGDCKVSWQESDCSLFDDEGDTLANNKGLARILKSSLHSLCPRIFILGSCDGLILLKDTKSPSLYLWNPTTLEHRQIPNPLPNIDSGIVWGIGYVSSTDDYNIIKICPRSKNENYIQVFSLMDNNWTSSLEQVNGGLTGLGVTVDSVIYWAMTKPYDFGRGEYGWCIVGFDLVAKKFVRVPLPHWQTGGFSYPPLMCVREGRLCACWRTSSKSIEIGVLMQCGGKRSWMKLYCYNHGYHCDWNMHGVTDKGRFVFRFSDRIFPDSFNYTTTLILVDPEQEPPKNVHRLKIPKSRNLFNYVESLISPYGPVELTKTSQTGE